MTFLACHSQVNQANFKANSAKKTKQKNSHWCKVQEACGRNTSATVLANSGQNTFASVVLFPPYNIRMLFNFEVNLMKATTLRRCCSILVSALSWQLNATTSRGITINSKVSETNCSEVYWVIYQSLTFDCTSFKWLKYFIITNSSSTKPC